MKHLEIFNNPRLSASDILDIKDIFQDYVDDYDIEYIDNSVEVPKSGGLYYKWVTAFHPVLIIYNSVFGDKYKFELLVDDVCGNFIPRLRRDGFILNKREGQLFQGVVIQRKGNLFRIEFLARE